MSKELEKLKEENAQLRAERDALLNVVERMSAYFNEGKS